MDSEVPLSRDAGELALRRLLLIPHMPVAVNSESRASPIIHTMRALSPMRKSTPLRRDPSGLERVNAASRFDPQKAGLKLSALLGEKREDSPRRGVSSASGTMLEFMGPPPLQLSKGVASSITAYHSGDELPSRALDYSVSDRSGDTDVSHFHFLTGKGMPSSSATVSERPRTPVTPSMLRAIMGTSDGSAPVTHRYLIGKEGEQALREAPVIHARIQKAKSMLSSDGTDERGTDRAIYRQLVQRDPDGWFQRRSANIFVRFRVSVPQLLMYPLLFPSVTNATTYFPNESPGLSLSELICNMTADDLIRLASTAVREHLISPAILSLGLESESSKQSIYHSLLDASRQRSCVADGPSCSVIEDQVLLPFKPLMACFDHNRACESLVVAWPLEKPEVSFSAAQQKGSTLSRPQTSFPTSGTHTFLYLQGPHRMSSFPLVSAWSRSMLLNRDRHASMIDIFVIARGAPNEDS